MMPRQTRWAPRRPARRGFSLVELLVVIAIITVLIAMLSAGYMKYYSLGPRKATETLIVKLMGEIERQWQAIRDDARNENKDRISGQPKTHEKLLSMTGNDNDRATDLWIGVRRKQEFPTSFLEARGSVTYQGFSLRAKPEYAQALAGRGAQDGHESSICLFLALDIGRRGTVFDASSLSARELKTQPNGLRYFADGWGRSLIFTINEVTFTDPTTRRPAIGLKYEIRSLGEDGVPSNDDLISNVNVKLGR